MAGIASLGPCTVKYKKEGGSTIKTLGYMHDEDDVVFEGSIESISHGAHGITGAVEKRDGAFESTVAMSLYLDMAAYADLCEQRVSESLGVYTVSGSIGKKIVPVQLHLRPNGNSDASEDLLFYRAFPQISENVVWTSEGKAKLNITFELAQALDTGKIYEFGVELV